MSYNWTLLINHFIQWLFTWPRFETEAWVARKWPVADLQFVCCEKEKIMFVIVIQTATTECSKNVYCTAHCIIDCRPWTCVTFNERTRQISYVFAAKPHSNCKFLWCLKFLTDIIYSNDFCCRTGFTFFLNTNMSLHCGIVSDVFASASSEGLSIFRTLSLTTGPLCCGLGGDIPRQRCARLELQSI